jgi:quinoprotein glucose dehydrogenase
MRFIFSTSLLAAALPLLALDPQYSPLKQVNTKNVQQLAVAWRYDTRDAFPGSEIQCRPVFDEGVLYATSPKGRLFALNAATGQELWSFFPLDPNTKPFKVRNRGVMLHRGSGGQKTLFYAIRNFLYAVDAKTGKLREGFANHGRLDLREGLGRPPAALSVGMTSPGVFYQDPTHGDLMILGSITSEDLPSAPGFIRAYSVQTGKLVWTFHTIPQPGEPGYETWPPDAYKRTGSANSWPGLTIDQQRGIVFVPTGSAAFDFWGGDRAGDNLYANSLLALNAKTGKRLWHFQFVRHDVWDRDLPTAPVLVTVKRNGQSIDAVAQATKSGHVWVFHRETGESLFPFQEIDVPPSDVPGEKLSPKQVLPLAPPPFARQEVTEDLLSDRTPEVHAELKARFAKLRSGPQFTPPSREGTFIFPGFDGGAEWGGQAWDPATGLFYVNSNEMAWVLRIIPRPTNVSDAKSLYNKNCAGCHRPDLKGTPPEFPSLLNLGAKLSRDEVTAIIREGAGRMPGFPDLNRSELRALVNFMLVGENEALNDKDESLNPQVPWGSDGYNKFLDKDGYPGIKPPWGTLNAIDLNSGKIRWQIPLGEHPKLKQPGTGSENYGGPVVTAGGLVFIAATNFDNKIRAFDKLNGKLLWEAELPAAGNATPEVYEWQGRQYIVIACGGGKSGAPSGGEYVAFALPQSGTPRPKASSKK